MQETVKGEAIRFEVENNIARITLNRPDKRNSINRAMRKELQEAFTEIKYNNDIFVTILTGEGNVFCAGKDLFEQIPEDGTVMNNDELYVFMRHIYKPFIAALNGPCLAQGAGFALLSDIRIMSDRATLGWPQVRRGISSVSGPTLFAHEVPLASATKYLLRGVPMSPQEALDLRVVAEVVPHEQLLDAAHRWADEILEAAPTAVQAVKEAAVRTQGLQFEDRVRMARQIADRVLLTEDSKEGVQAFKEKRDPVWQGR